MKQRAFYLDFLRSFAIIMVLLLHSISGYITNPKLYETTSWYAYLVINAFSRTGVPLFLMISGSLMLSGDNTKNFKAFYKKAFKRIIVPLVFWNLAYFIYKCIVGDINFDITLLMSGFLNSGTEYHLWYLYTLSGIYLIAPFLKIIVDACNKKQQMWLLFLMLLCTTIRPFVNHIISPAYIYLFDGLFNGYVGFFLMGYILSTINITNKTKVTFFAAGVTCAIISVFSHHILSSDKGINLIFNNGYSFCHCVLAAAIFVISKKIFEQKKMIKNSIAEIISKYSFGIYLVHAMITDLVLKYFMIDSSPIISSIYLFIITFAVSFVLSVILGKIKYIKKTVGI